MTSVRKVEVAGTVDRNVILTDLVILGLVRIKIVLPVKGRILNHTVQCESNTNGKLYGSLIQYRKRSRKAQADRTNIGIWLRTETIRTATKQLGRCLEFRVDFESDHDLPVFRQGTHAGAPSSMTLAA